MTHECGIAAAVGVLFAPLRSFNKDKRKTISDYGRVVCVKKRRRAGVSSSAPEDEDNIQPWTRLKCAQTIRDASAALNARKLHGGSKDHGNGTSVAVLGENG
jgi:hypothetical protein